MPLAAASLSLCPRRWPTYLPPLTVGGHAPSDLVYFSSSGNADDVRPQWATYSTNEIRHVWTGIDKTRIDLPITNETLVRGFAKKGHEIMERAHAPQLDRNLWKTKREAMNVLGRTGISVCALSRWGDGAPLTPREPRWTERCVLNGALGSRADRREVLYNAGSWLNMFREKRNVYSIGAPQGGCLTKWTLPKWNKHCSTVDWQTQALLQKAPTKSIKSPCLL